MTLDAQLYAQAREFGLNVSRIAEDALRTTVARVRAERLAADVRTDAEALARYEAEHGSFAEFARAHYAETGASEGTPPEAAP